MSYNTKHFTGYIENTKMKKKSLKSSIIDKCSCNLFVDKDSKTLYEIAQREEKAVFLSFDFFRSGGYCLLQDFFVSVCRIN